MGQSSIEEEDICPIYNKTFGRKDEIHSFGVNGWPNFKEQAENEASSKFIKIIVNIYIH